MGAGVVLPPHGGACVGGCLSPFNPRVVGSSPTGPTASDLRKQRIWSPFWLGRDADHDTSRAWARVMATKTTRRGRGSVDRLPSGTYRVRVFAGTDPLTGKRHDLVDVADTAAAAEKVRTKLLAQVDERRNPRTKATVDRLFDRYLEVLDVEPATARTYRGYIANHLRPALGKLQVGQLDGETLDRFYGQLRLCRARCGGARDLVDHRIRRAHDCDTKCRPHVCSPMNAATVRQIHWILAGALARAVRWRWITTNPIDAAQPPTAPRPNPSPPTPEQAARIVQAAWDEDHAWGALLWLVMTTGARRGEICAVRRHYVDLENAVLTLPRNLDETTSAEKDTKTHQQRRITLDADTVDILRAHLDDLDRTAGSLGVGADPNAFLFSYSPTGHTPMQPSTVTHRYGRLGHGGGGTTTMRTYAAWVSKADQRAASVVGGRMKRPTTTTVR
jgi:integrase